MSVKKTALYDIHVEHGGKMVEFAGYFMPIQYSSILDEHKRVRTSLGVFDVSHMGEIEIRGVNALKMVDRLTTNDASKIAINQAQYSAMCYEDGGIVDDLIVYNRGDHYLLVVNASNIEKDYNWMLRNKIDGVKITNISDTFTQLAVQGKQAETVLQQLTDVDLSAIKFYWFAEGELGGVQMIISRTGYTGEPGFELYFDASHSTRIWKAVFAAGAAYDIEPIGLGARDSLRLEKKYCLYGNDITAETNPLEAGLGWITKLEKGEFIGSKRLNELKAEGIKRKLVGFTTEGRMIPRPGYEVRVNGNGAGEVTSGAYSPILEKNIGLAYIQKEHAAIDTRVEISVRNRSADAVIVKTPFV